VQIYDQLTILPRQAALIFMRRSTVRYYRLVRSFESRASSNASLCSLTLASIPVGGLLSPISAYRHAAPAPHMSPSVIRKHQCVGGSLARFHV
jgi:hypothetical protein